MRVLIVDDDSDTAELTAECLMEDGDVTVQIAQTVPLHFAWLPNLRPMRFCWMSSCLTHPALTSLPI